MMKALARAMWMDIVVTLQEFRIIFVPFEKYFISLPPIFVIRFIGTTKYAWHA